MLVVDGHRQIPKTGRLFFINFLIIGIAYFPVAAGSPGPLDKKIPLGFCFNICPSALVLHETIVTLQLKSEKYLKIFFLIP